MRPDLVILTAGVNDAFAAGYPDEGGPDNTAFRRSWSWRPPPAWKRALLRRSHLARLAWRSWLARGGASPGDFTAAMQHTRPPDAQAAENAGRATGRYFRRNLDTLILLIRHAGAAPVLATNPLNPARETGQGPYYDAVSAAVLRNNDIVRDAARRAGAPVIDLYGALRDPGQFRDAAHVTAAGMDRTAGVIEAGLVPVLERRFAVATGRRPER
jgi:lysophospholipase L1-like esterase